MVSYSLCVVAACLLMAHAMIEDAQELNFEPRVAVKCGEIPQHLDTTSGRWMKHKDKFCPKNVEDILNFCKKAFPKIDVTNIVEDNSNVTICDSDDCQETLTVIPYRCLVGQFEADALTYPPDAQCNFGYVHEAENCKGHDYWHGRAVNICGAKEKKLQNYGILIACGIDTFTGVEYVCCKAKKTAAEMFADALKLFASHIPVTSKGCDRSKYEMKGRMLRIQNDKKVKEIAKKLKDAKDRMEQLKSDDGEQAQAFYRNTIKVLQNSLRMIEEQAGLDTSQLRQERRECIQIDTNHKKHLAMRRFANALKHHLEKPERILKTFKSFMHTLDIDQQQNARFLSRLLHSKSPIAQSARKTFAPHIDHIKALLKEGVDLLKEAKTVAGKIDFNLPSWADGIDFKWAHEPTTAPPQSTEINPTDPTPAYKGGAGALEEGSGEEQDGDDDDTSDHPMKSRAVFAAVIGLSCGALVIMVVIVLALFLRNGSAKRPTKIVIADDDNQESRHLLKMQQDGFENPTYKFFAR